MSTSDGFMCGEMSPAVIEALSHGFNAEQAIEAESLVGGNPDMVLSYLM
jgi:hypothetical protein